MLPMIRVDKSYSVLVRNKSYNISDSHPRFEELRQAVYDGDEEAFLDNFSVEKAATVAYSGTGVQVQDGTVTYNGVIVHNVICDRIVSFVEDNIPVGPMIKFLENLMENPSSQSVKELYGFLEHQAMPITEDGCFLAYKSVRENYLDKHSGTCDNTPGQVLEMPRNMVDDNRDSHCSHGYHVGSLKYAGPGGFFHNGYNDRVVIVKVNPRDAVSVPGDHNAQKLRVCKYEVIADYDGDLPNTFKEVKKKTTNLPKRDSRGRFISNK